MVVNPSAGAAQSDQHINSKSMHSCLAATTVKPAFRMCVTFHVLDTPQSLDCMSSFRYLVCASGSYSETGVPPAQIDLLLCDTISPRVNCLGTSGIKSSILPTNVEAIARKDRKEDEVASEDHAETSVKVRSIIPHIRGPDVRCATESVDKGQTGSSFRVWASNV
jgi:hypothetical protein